GGSGVGGGGRVGRSTGGGEEETAQNGAAIRRAARRRPTIPANSVRWCLGTEHRRGERAAAGRGPGKRAARGSAPWSAPTPHSSREQCRTVLRTSAAARRRSAGGCRAGQGWVAVKEGVTGGLFTAGPTGHGPACVREPRAGRPLSPSPASSASPLPSSVPCRT